VRANESVLWLIRFKKEKGVHENGDAPDRTVLSTNRGGGGNTPKIGKKKHPGWGGEETAFPRALASINCCPKLKRGRNSRRVGTQRGEGGKGKKLPDDWERKSGPQAPSHLVIHGPSLDKKLL